MKAKLLPLEGKHYGSIIEVSDLQYTTQIKIWENADHTPSERELERHGYTTKEWSENAMVDNCFGGLEPIRSSGVVSDCHFESKWQYDLCKKIVEAINT